MTRRDDEADQLRARLLSAVRETRGAVLDDAWTAVRAIPTYDRLPAARQDEVLRSIRWMFEAFVTCLVEDRGLAPKETARLEQIGRSRARQGVPLPVFDQAFRNVYEAAFRQLVDLAERDPEPRMVRVIGDLSSELHLLSLAASTAIARGHAQESEHRGAVRERARMSLVDVVLAGPGTASDMGAEAERLGVDLDGPIHLIVAVSRSPADDPRLNDLLDDLAARRSGVLAGPVRDQPVTHAIVLVAGVEPSIIGKSLEPAASRYEAVVLHQRFACADEVGRQYLDVRPHLPLAAGLAGDRAVMALEELSVYGLLDGLDVDRVESFVRACLGRVLGLPADRAADFVETLEAYLECGGRPLPASRRLHLHPKSVSHRLRAIRRQTGLDPTGGQLGMSTLLALKLLRSHHDRLPPLGDGRWIADPPRG